MVNAGIASTLASSAASSVSLLPGRIAANNFTVSDESRNASSASVPNSARTAAGSSASQISPSPELRVLRSRSVMFLADRRIESAARDSDEGSCLGIACSRLISLFMVS
mgnify:FL=1